MEQEEGVTFSAPNPPDPNCLSLYQKVRLGVVRGHFLSTYTHMVNEHVQSALSERESVCLVFSAERSSLHKFRRHLAIDDPCNILLAYR